MQSAQAVRCDREGRWVTPQSINGEFVTEIASNGRNHEMVLFRQEALIAARRTIGAPPVETGMQRSGDTWPPPDVNAELP